MERRRLRPDARGRGAAWWSAALLPPLAVGMALRLYRLEEQILTGDELHTVNGALTRTVGEILRTWTYHGADYSVPLTAFFRLLMDGGVVLGEMGFRAPSLLASALILTVLPLALRRRLGPWPTLVLAWLLAISPMLVLYGRIVRSYAPWTLCGLAAALAFEHWWTRGSRAAGAAFVALGALAIHLHLGAVPLLGSCFLFAAMLAARDWPERRSRLPGLALLAGALISATVLLLLPARASLLELVGLHGRGEPPILRTWIEITRLQAGTDSVALAGIVLLALARGAWILAVRDRDFALYLLVLGAGHVIGLAFLAPNFLHAAIVANRYVVILLPIALALVSLGLAVPHPRVPGSAHAVGVAGLLLALFATGPLARPEYRWSSFTHTQPFILFTRPGDRIPDAHIPRFYTGLGPGEEPILEAPWTNVGTHSFAAYQRIHRRPLRVASANRLHADPRVALRNTVPFTAEAVARSGARWVVVHTDLRSEEQFVETSELRHAERVQKLGVLWRKLRASAARLGADLEASLGPPADAGDGLRVWDLSRATRAATPEGGRALPPEPVPSGPSWTSP